MAEEHKPLLSVIVPVHNTEKYIGECIESILAAGERLRPMMPEESLEEMSGLREEAEIQLPIQLILVDDGSVDRSGEICRSYAERFSCVEYVYQQNSGVSTARNRGMSLAEADYISFVDGDDRVTEELFAGLFSGMDKETDIVCCTCRTTFDGEEGEEHFYQGDFLARTPEEKKKLYLQLLDEEYGRSGGSSTAIGVPWGKLYRRSFLEENHLSFDPLLRRMQDNVFNMEAFARAQAVRYLDRPLYVYRLSHVSGYIRGTSLVEPKVLNRIALLRRNFFRKHTEFMDEKVKKAYDFDMIRFFGTAMQYYAVHEKSPGSAVRRIRSFCEGSVIASELRKTESSSLPPKRKLLLFLVRTRRYRSLYLLYDGICRKQKLK